MYAVLCVGQGQGELRARWGYWEQGGYPKIPELSPAHKWLFVGCGEGVPMYVCTFFTSEIAPTHTMLVVIVSKT